MKDALIDQCLEILRRHDVKNELKNLMTPLIEVILIELYLFDYVNRWLNCRGILFLID